MLGVIKALTDVCNYVKELKTYYSLKNQTLWTGSWTTSAQSQQIPNIDKYNTVLLYPWNDYTGIILQRISNTVFSGEGMVQGVTSANTHTSVESRLNYDSNNNVTIVSWNGLHHQGGSNHSQTFGIQIVKIVGVDPVAPQTLTKLGGGIDAVRGWLYAVSEKVSTGYRKFCEYVNRRTTRVHQSRSIIDSVGKHFGNCFKFSKSSREVYNFSNNIFSSSSRIWSMYIFNKLPRFVQHHSKQYFDDPVQHGFQEQLYDNAYNLGCLDSNRQSVTSDWGCYCA